MQSTPTEHQMHINFAVEVLRVSSALCCLCCTQCNHNATRKPLACKVKIPRSALYPICIALLCAHTQEPTADFQKVVCISLLDLLYIFYVRVFLFTSRCCSNVPKITEVVVLANLNCNHNCVYQSVAGKIGDNTIHTCTYIYNTHSQYLCTDHSHTHRVTNYTHSLVM